MGKWKTGQEKIELYIHVPRSISPSRKQPRIDQLRQKTTGVYADCLQQSYTMLYSVLRLS
jgi:hypothetical protein